MLKSIERLVFFLLIFFISSQVGKHFWPEFSYISGIRVDYLSPTIHITDILILCLFVITLYNSVRNKNTLHGEFISSIFLRKTSLPFILLLIISTFFAKSAHASIFGLIKFFEFIFFGFYTAYSFQKKDISIFVDTLSLSSIPVSLLAIWQFFKQASVGGLFYFLGERTFNTSTIGIATINIGGREILRPYATFPHPNVLAFFLLIVIVLMLYRFFQEKVISEKVFLLIVLLLSHVALGLTLSRTILLCYFIIVLYFGIKFIKNRIIKLFSVISIFLLLVVYLYVFSQRFFGQEVLRDLFLRADLIQIYVEIFKQYPYFGVGLNNFFIHEISHQTNITPTLLQPVHNIYLLVLVQVGIFGFLPFLWFLKKSLSRVVLSIKHTKDKESKEFYKSILILFLSILFVGLFDHFFLTLQQGELMFTLVLGLAWSRMR